MTDRDLRTLERNAEATGSDHDLLTLAYARIRAGLAQEGTVKASGASPLTPDQLASALVRQSAQVAATVADEEQASAILDAGHAAAQEVKAAPAADGWYPVLYPLAVTQLREHVARAAKAKRKLGALPVRLEARTPFALPRHRPDGSVTMIPVCMVRIRGEIPTIDGWRVIGLLRHWQEPAPEGSSKEAAKAHRKAAPVMTTIRVDHSATPEEAKQLDRYRARGRHCDECEANRRGRRAWADTVVVTHPEHGPMQLGRNCVERYIGTSPALAFAAMDLLGLITEQLLNHSKLGEGEQEARGPSLLEYAAQLLRADGYGQGAHYQASTRGLDACTPAQVEEAARTIERAQADLLPSLRVERERANSADPDSFEWPADVARLPLRWHNLACVVAAGAVPYALEPHARGLFTWAQEADRLAAEAEADRRAAQLKANPTQAANVLAALLVEHGTPATATGLGGVALDADALAGLLIEISRGGATPALLSLCRAIVTGDETLSTPPHVERYLAAEGAEGTWTLSIDKKLPFRKGGGYVVKFSHLGRDGITRHGVIFARNGSDAAALNVGERVQVLGRIREQQWNSYDKRPEVILNPSEITAA